MLSKFFSVRSTVLAGLFLTALQISFNLALHQRALNVQDAWDRVAQDNPGLASILSVVDSFVDIAVHDNNSISRLTRTVGDAKQQQQQDADNTARFAKVDQKSEYAYAFVVGGCNPAEQDYKGFLYNILVATRILREEGSTADVVAYFQISYKSDADTLPAEDVRLLSALGIRIMYIPKSYSESFYETVLNKFRILALTEYQRVLLMDADVMPVANIDYLFHLSMNGTLKENIVVSGNTEPANAGFFMVQPGEGEYERITDIIRRREEKAVGIKSGHKFDEVEGWGHVIAPDDPWKSRIETGTKWTFHFAFSDQGLLYYYTKYVKQSVSIIYINDQVENWGTSGSGTVHLEETLDNPFQGLRRLRVKDLMACSKFMCDFYHFTGMWKPWMQDPKKNIADAIIEKENPLHVWWHTLFKLNDELAMGLDFENWKSERPPLGLYANFKQMDKRVMLRGAAHAPSRQAES
jgi:hypothetical protein